MHDSFLGFFRSLISIILEPEDVSTQLVRGSPPSVSGDEPKSSNSDPLNLRRLRDEDFETKSGAEIMENPMSGEDQGVISEDPTNPTRPKRKRYHRHTQRQIQELESLNMNATRIQFLKAENEKLRTDNLRYREALANTSCPNCGDPAALGESVIRRAAATH
ncbi:hypothetical protein MLD38_009990 [Melastoma candidum]|uniref:Uncharacterized protein n=1 Tax=Melastoma candidum TaxID=119954 RepID=A0ACB9QYD1_9MYRT|nr:hypothetical protein MLD38_009990 [Melastoma candidum]